MSMEQDAVVESNDVLLNDATPASPADIQLAQSIANTRIVSQDTVYLVEDVEIETVHQIDAFYRSTISSSFTIDGLRDNGGDGDIYSLLTDEPIDKSEITIGKLTPQHIGKQPATGKRKDRCVPIEPIEYREDDTTTTAYFAEVSTHNVAKINLRGNNGERQTVYKIVPDRAVERFTNYVGSTVELGATEDSVTLTGSSSETQDSFTAEPSLRERATSTLTRLWGTHSSILLAICGIWATSVLATHATTLVTTEMLGLLSTFIGVAIFLVILSVVSEEQAETDPDTDTGTQPTDQQIEEDQNVEITLDQPETLTPKYDTASPVTKVDVTQSFDEQLLTLAVTDQEETIEWEYETNPDGVFTDTKIMEFYTELGFNYLDQQQFEAYLSTKNYYNEQPFLVTTTDARRNLYLYPNDPTATQD